MAMETVDRIRMLVEHEGMNVSSFAKKIGFNQSNFSKILRGERKVPANLIELLLDQTKVNRTWLLTGEGDMLNGSDVSLVEPTDVIIEEEVHVTPNGTRFLQTDRGNFLMEVPVVPIAALGSPEDEWAERQQQEPIETLKFDVDGVHKGNYWVFKVEGHSMDNGTYDGFRQGDTVLVRELPRDEWAPKLHINTWPYWVVVFDNNVRLKQIVAQDNEAGTITLHSLNPSPEYTDFTLPLSSITHLFNVIRNDPRPNIYKK